MWQKQALLVDMTFCQILRDEVAHKDYTAAIEACVVEACWGNILDQSQTFLYQLVICKRNMKT